MTTSNAINADNAGLVRYDGAGTFTGVTVTQHDLLVGASSNGITSVAPSATSGVPVISQGAAADPTFGTAVVAGGGTGRTTLTNHGVLVGAATSAITQLAAGSAGQVLQSGGAAADPLYSTATFPSTATSTGTILRADGTNWVATTATYPATTTASQVLYSSSNNVVAGLSTANDGLLVTSNTGVPSILAGPGSTGNVLQSNAAAAPSFSTATYPSTASGTGTILRADGTNWSATTATYPNTSTINQLIYSTAANVLGGLATANNGTLVTSNTGVPSILAGPGTTGNVLQSNSAAAPSFSTATYPSTATGTGTIMRADGTNWVATTATYPATTTINQVLYSSAANVVGGITAANNGTMISGTTGVPSWLANGTTGQVLTATTGSPPSWAAASAGSSPWTQITQTSVSTQSTIAFTSASIANYNELLIIVDSVTGSTTDNWILNLSTDGGSTYTVTCYKYLIFGAGNSGASASTTPVISTTSVTTAQQGYIHILNNANSTLPKCIDGMIMDQAAVSILDRFRITTASVSQITAVKLSRAAGTFNAGTVTLIGR